ncbi:MAG TPA: hypothetical protein VGM13_03730 [Thermoanaerobaculia bacterium]|jgi:hypothetical protein
MKSRRSVFGTASVALVLTALALASPAPAAAPAGTDLWGGPGARGTGSNGAKFDTTITVSSLAAANGSVDFVAGGLVVATAPFTLASRGVASLATPAALDGKGAFLYHVRSDASVSAWSETYNDTPNGRYSTSFTAFPVSDFLTAGDEAWGGGADASTSTAPGRARTNVGILCSPLGAQGCNVEWAAFDGGTLVGSAVIFAAPGAAAQQALATLVPAAAEKSKLAVRARVSSGSAMPYAVKNDNLSSDGAATPLSVVRSAFSTAPVINAFTITPLTGCSPLTALATWITTGADHVNIAGASGDLPPSGSTNITVVATGDVILTAVASSGATATQPKRVTVNPPTDPPTPSPSSVVTAIGLTTTGILPISAGAVTVTFVTHESTGSTFTVVGHQFTYKAGTTIGTDVVRLTSQGLCGPGVATFTATVVDPGTPVITSFTADPPRGCGGSSNIVLGWTTENSRGVTINVAPAAYPYPANGATGITITGTTTAVLTAYGIFGGSDVATASLTIPVDTQAWVPVVTPASIVVAPSSPTVLLTVTGVPDPAEIRWLFIQNRSGSLFQSTATPGVFAYVPGFKPGVDLVRIFFTNGCGSQYAEFTATVQ